MEDPDKKSGKENKIASKKRISNLESESGAKKNNVSGLFCV
jgi:hypothetical protein